MGADDATCEVTAGSALARKNSRKPGPKSGKDKKQESTPEFIASIASVLVTGLFIITFIVQAFEIPSSSMEKTLLIGDHVFVNRVSFAPATSWIEPLLPYQQVRRGDIIVFLSPEQPGLYLVKRVIAVPGDRLRLRSGVVYLNGVPQNEPYVQRDGSFIPYRDEFPSVMPPPPPPYASAGLYDEFAPNIHDGELVIPPGDYFGMGDNRDNSKDSRYWGFIPRANIIGRPAFIYWSFRESPDQYKKTSIGDRIAFIFHVITHFPTDTRWGRMFKLVR